MVVRGMWVFVGSWPGPEFRWPWPEFRYPVLTAVEGTLKVGREGMKVSLRLQPQQALGNST